MSIIGKIVGGAAGFAIGGPIGALLGAIAGHAVDMYRSGESGQGDIEAGDEDATRQIGFTIGVIVLGAKMAKADGVVTKNEIAAFKQVFRTPPEEERNVGRLFDQARRDARGFEPYARQIHRMLADRPHVLEELLGCLFLIAKADGRLHPDELTYLHQVAEIFGFDEAEFRRIKDQHLGPDEGDPYHVLGVAPDASEGEIKAAYRRLIRDNHPDRLIAEGVPEEFVEVANRKMAAINAAWAEIRKARGIS